MTTDNSTPSRPLYWFIYHSTRGVRNFAGKHRRTAAFAGITAAVALVHFRAAYHSLVLDCRKLAFPALVVLSALLVIRVLWQSRRRIAKLGVILLVIFVGAAGIAGAKAYRYVSLYSRYRALSPVELETLPVSDHERIQAENSIYALAHDAVNEGESPVRPDFVRVGAKYDWTMAIEPSYPISRITRGVRELFEIPGTSPSAAFTAENRVPVRFSVGEHLLFSRSSHTATIRSFSPWRYLNYEPDEVIYIPDEHGGWVQIVTLIHWRGFLFPQPEFGGVQLIRQEPESFGAYVRLLLRGAGEWIPADEVAKHSFLKGQNILSRAVSRRIADSFRYQSGFFSPFPGYHDGDVRVPELQSEENPQPFVGFFRRSSADAGTLYHYFALEPFDAQKQGLSTSVFVPADGTPNIYVFRHYKNGGLLSGVSSISTKVMESRKTYDWDRNHPVEHRPFIKEVDGSRRFYWLTTVVTARIGKDKGHFIAGSIPEIVITDAKYNLPVWVDSRTPESWLRTLQDAD